MQRVHSSSPRGFELSLFFCYFRNVVGRSFSLSLAPLPTPLSLLTNSVFKMSIVGLAAHTLLFAEFAYELSLESENFYGPTDDPAVRTADVEAISNVLASLSASLSTRLGEIDAISIDGPTDSNKLAIIALASRSKVLADELVVALTPLECVTPISIQNSKQAARTLWEEDRQPALQARLNEVRESLPHSLVHLGR